MADEIEIRPLHRDELAQLDDIAPAGWATNINTIFSFHYGQAYFYCIGAVTDGKVAGCANGLWNGKAGWLGNIVVRPEWRGRGLGTALTSSLMAFFKGKGCDSQLLIATELGEPIYRKLGFERSGIYIFMKNEQTAHLKPVRNVRPLAEADVPEVQAIDREISGEAREAFLGRFLAGGCVFPAKGTLDGFFLPSLANGLVLARTERAGLALLRYKMARGGPLVVVPEQNAAALDLLKRSGYRESARAPRMFFGEEVAWQPAGVYSRGSGFCG